MAEKLSTKLKLTKSVHPGRPDWDFFMVDQTEAQLKDLAKPRPFPPTCQKACTETITLLPTVSLPPKSGIGFPPVNIDGFRWLNAYITSDPVTSTNQRGFSMELWFSLNPFVINVGVKNQARSFFNLGEFFDNTAGNHQTIYMSMSDLTRNGGLPYYGGSELTQLLRIPVMGPFVTALAFNEDSQTHNAQILGYLST